MDITKCKGKNCIVKDRCIRYTQKAETYQSWFLKEPFKIKDNVFTCETFWGDIDLEGVIFGNI